MELMTIGEVTEKLGLPDEAGRQRIHYLLRQGKLTPSRRTGKNGRIVLFATEQLPEIVDVLSKNGDSFREDTLTAPNGDSL